MQKNIVNSAEPCSSSHWPYYANDEIAAVTEVLKSGKVNYWTGEQTRLFEKEYAHSVGTEYAVALMNGTVALEAALYALNIGVDDEVITTSRTFIASASAVVLRGAKPIFADVDLHTQNITAETIEAVITAKTKAIIVVHLAGWPCEMDKIMALAQKYKLRVIEDCAQAHGAAIYDRQVGAWGDVAAFSFCQDKIITTGGEGGMVTTNSHEIWEKIWSYKDHGKNYTAVHRQDHPAGFRWVHESFGTNWRMTEMQAAIGRIQLRKLPEWLDARKRNATILNDAFSSLEALRITLPPQTVKHAYYKCYVFLRPEVLKKGWDRDYLLKTISDAGVKVQSGSCSEIYREKAFINSDFSLSKRLPNAKILGETSLMFLVHPTLTLEYMQKTADVIMDIMRQASQ